MTHTLKYPLQYQTEFFREELLQLLQCSAILSYFVLQIKSNQTSKLI